MTPTLSEPTRIPFWVCESGSRWCDITRRFIGPFQHLPDLPTSSPLRIDTPGQGCIFDVQPVEPTRVRAVLAGCPLAGMLIELTRSNVKQHTLNVAQIRQGRPDVLLIVALANVSRRETQAMSLILQEFGVAAVVASGHQFARAARLIRRRFDCSCRETPLPFIGGRR